MKIAFLTTEYPHQLTGSSGGIGTSIKNLAQSLIQVGVEVRILIYGQCVDGIFKDGDITVQQIKNVKFKGLSKLFTQRKITKIINDLYTKKQIDGVEAPDWCGMTSFIQPKNCPIVIRLHGSDTYFCHLEKRPVKWINKFHEKRALKYANGHISVSQYTANITNELFKQNFEYTIIPNSVDSNNFVSDNNAGENTILYFGTLIRKKGVLDIPLIFNLVVERISTAQLILVGHDSFDIKTKSESTLTLMKKLFSDKALENVVYKGKVPYVEIEKIISQSTVCIFPSYAEAFPVSWLEAMAMSKAIVASDIGWANEMLINNESAMFSHPSDHENFANAIFEILQDKILQRNLGLSARQTFLANFSSAVIVKKNLDFYKKIIERNINNGN
jgi:glycosyltransferase involved in cell wall biosynthesis